MVVDTVLPTSRQIYPHPVWKLYNYIVNNNYIDKNNHCWSCVSNHGWLLQTSDVTEAFLGPHKEVFLWWTNLPERSQDNIFSSHFKFFMSSKFPVLLVWKKLIFLIIVLEHVFTKNFADEVFLKSFHCFGDLDLNRNKVRLRVVKSSNGLGKKI